MKLQYSYSRCWCEPNSIKVSKISLYLHFGCWNFYNQSMTDFWSRKTTILFVFAWSNSYKDLKMSLIFTTHVTVENIEQILPHLKLWDPRNNSTVVGWNVPCATQPFTRLPRYKHFLLWYYSTITFYAIVKLSRRLILVCHLLEILNVNQ